MRKNDNVEIITTVAGKQNPMTVYLRSLNSPYLSGHPARYPEYHCAQAARN
jgi:hypothetical protein